MSLHCGRWPPPPRPYVKPENISYPQREISARVWSHSHNKELALFFSHPLHLLTSQGTTSATKAQ